MSRDISVRGHQIATSHWRVSTLSKVKYGKRASTYLAGLFYFNDQYSRKFHKTRILFIHSFYPTILIILPVKVVAITEMSTGTTETLNYMKGRHRMSWADAHTAHPSYCHCSFRLLPSQLYFVLYL